MGFFFPSLPDITTVAQVAVRSLTLLLAPPPEKPHPRCSGSSLMTPYSGSGFLWQKTWPLLSKPRCDNRVILHSHQHPDQ